MREARAVRAHNRMLVRMMHGHQEVAQVEDSSARTTRSEFLRRAALVASGVFLGGAAVAVGKPGGRYPVALADEEEGKTSQATRVRYGMVIDLRRCIGCDACTVACKQENHTPPGVSYNVVIKEETGTYPNTGLKLLPRPCMQCEDPPCAKVCPVAATWKRDDGIVEIDYEKCIGCRYCMTACPYGARYFDFGENYNDKLNEFEIQPSQEYGKSWERVPGASPIGNVRKCHFCLHRLEQGKEPACVVTCMSKARTFGNLNDPQSAVSKLIADRRAYRLKQDLGTGPSVYYLA
ncbi:MAG: 4Fe-4S dicluster domain-containing protein [Firmicutes bacterium]|nr:4Fe-4S dicluster domain-containing protein [Bacillota bacterium]